MAYVGSPPASRVLSSADIAQGSVTLDDINFTDQPTNMDISGTIDKHTMRLADGVTVVGDVTISDNLILSKISDDGNAITLTNDSSTRTITGTGSLEASTLTQTPNASLTGMTGTIGDAVTGSPALNLSNATFPAGCVLQAVQYTLASGDTGGQPTISSTGPTSFSTAFKKSITITAGNTIFVTTSLCITKTGGVETYFTLRDNTLGVYLPSSGADGHFGGAVSADSQFVQMSYSILYTPTSGTVHEIEVKGGATNSNTLTMNKQHSYAAQGRMSSSLILMEIQT